MAWKRSSVRSRPGPPIISPSNTTTYNSSISSVQTLCKLLGERTCQGAHECAVNPGVYTSGRDTQATVSSHRSALTVTNRAAATVSATSAGLRLMAPRSENRRERRVGRRVARFSHGRWPTTTLLQGRLLRAILLIRLQYEPLKKQSSCSLKPSAANPFRI
jgi:hypothetical protein